MRMIVVVSGGVVQSIAADGPVEVTLADWDDYNESGDENDLLEAYPVDVVPPARLDDFFRVIHKTLEGGA